MGSDTTWWRLSSTPPAAHKTMGHHSQCVYSPARLKHTPMPCPSFGTSAAPKSPALQMGTSELQHLATRDPHLPVSWPPSTRCRSCFPTGLEGNVCINPHLCPSGLTAFSYSCFGFTFREATLYISQPAQHPHYQIAG